MAIYSEYILPRIVDRACGLAALRPVRERACAGLHGRIVEIGFGSGSNVALYPAAVTDVAAVEPSDTAWKLAGKRLGTAAVQVARTQLDAQRLDFGDATFDAALSTFTLCTVPDVSAALAEVRRVLKPGGTLHFLEHGLAPDPDVRKWQWRMDGLQQRLCGGCHVTRDIPQLIKDAGFTMQALDTFYGSGGPKFAGWFSIGVAVA